MKEVLKKLASARQIISNTKIKKKGLNKFSNYAYFTPDQVHQLVDSACQEVGLLTMFDLTRNDLGVSGHLTIFDIDSADKMEFVMASAIPEIKATNIAQQLGGAVTYTHRYLLMTAFCIVDNSLDFDTTENTRKVTSKPELKPDTKAWDNVVEYLKKGGDFKPVAEKYDISEGNRKQLIS